MVSYKRGSRCKLLAIGSAVAFFQLSPAFAQTLGQQSDDGISTWRIVASLLLCLVLAVGAAFVLKAKQGAIPLLSFALRKNNRRLHLIETLRLTHQTDLCIVCCDGQEMLVTTSVHGSAFLGRLPFAEPDKASGEGER